MLASCATAAKVDVNNEPKVEGLTGIFEDTDVHEEIFGKETLPFGGERKNAPVDPIEADDDDSIILGAQWCEYDSDDDDIDDKKAVRFIAAVTLTSTGADNTVTWTRAVWKNTGAVEKVSATRESKKAYTSLNNGNVEYSISDFNTSFATPKTFTHFVVYTLGGIELTTFDNYYITASVAIAGTDAAASNVIATTIDEGGTRFKFDAGSTGYFGVKLSNDTGAFQTIAAAGNPGEGNKAKIVGGAFAEDDAFLVVHLDETDPLPANHTFNVYGADALGSGVAFFDDTVPGSQLVTASVASSYDFYLNNSDELWPAVSASSINTTLYLVPNNNWKQADARFAIYTFNDAETESHWFDMTEIGTSGVYSCTNTFFTNVIFCRMNGATSDNNWDTKWNQTGDLRISSGNQYSVPEGAWDGSDRNHWGVHV